MSLKKVQRGTLYSTDGKTYLVKPLDSKKFQLSEMQDAIGGLIENVVPLNKRTKLWANEEGFLLRLPPNPHSVTVANLNVHAVPFLAGDLLSTYQVPVGEENDNARQTIEEIKHVG